MSEPDFSCQSQIFPVRIRFFLSGKDPPCEESGARRPPPPPNPERVCEAPENGPGRTRGPHTGEGREGPPRGAPAYLRGRGRGEKRRRRRRPPRPAAPSKWRRERRRKRLGAAADVTPATPPSGLPSPAVAQRGVALSFRACAALAAPPPWQAWRRLRPSAHARRRLPARPRPFSPLSSGHHDGGGGGGPAAPAAPPGPAGTGQPGTGGGLRGVTSLTLW